MVHKTATQVHLLCDLDLTHTGHLSTLCQRKRWFPNTNSANIHLKLHSDRQAVNFPVQGIVVVRVNRFYEEKSEKASPGVRTQGTSGLIHQYSATEPQQPDNHQPSQSSICTAQVALNASVAHLAATLQSDLLI